MSIAEEKYVALRTYRRSGDSSATPVWIADLGDGTVGFTTPGSSLKVTRLRRDNRVELEPSDGRGQPKEGSVPVSGTAVIVDGVDFERIRERIKAKYGWQVTLMTVIGKVMSNFGKNRVSDTGIVITLD